MFPTERGMKSHYGQVHNGSIAGEKQTCENCGNTYYVPPSRCGDTRFCSLDCLYEGDTSTTDNSHECENCEQKFESYEDRRFCSHSCYSSWLSNNNVGENHPNWKGGTEKYRGPSWSESRLEALRNANSECEECGMSNTDHVDAYSQELHVHHIIPFREFDSEEKANNQDNLKVLCSSCHKKAEPL